MDFEELHMYCPNLEVIDISNLLDNHIPQVGKFKRLNSLGVYNSRVTDIGIQNLVELLPTLHSLKIHYCMWGTEKSSKYIMKQITDVAAKCIASHCRALT